MWILFRSPFVLRHRPMESWLFCQDKRSKRLEELGNRLDTFSSQLRFRLEGERRSDSFRLRSAGHCDIRRTWRREAVGNRSKSPNRCWLTNKPSGLFSNVPKRIFFQGSRRFKSDLNNDKIGSSKKIVSLRFRRAAASLRENVNTWQRSGKTPSI